MTDKFKKDSTPPPLLLMPAGGGLTLTPPEQPNVLMPVVQSTPSLLDPDMEAEADSFVGQAPPTGSIPQSSASGGPMKYFQSGHGGASSDPFANVSSTQQPPIFPPMSNTFAPAQLPQRNIQPAPVFSPSQQSNVNRTSAGIPLPPPGASGASANKYRHQGGRPQYVPPPGGSTPNPPAMSQAVPGFPPAPPNVPGVPTAMVSPMSSPHAGAGQMPPYSPQNNNGQSATVPAGQDNERSYTGGLYYQPIRYHWCYQQTQSGLEVWRPFSVHDSTQLEMAFNNNLHAPPTNTVIITNGGRYEVNVGHRLRLSVYWDEAPTPVRRCSWFYKREGDNRYIPYEEDFCDKLENEYKKALETGGWHRRLEFPGKEIIVMHNANVIVHFPENSPPDEWGNAQNVYSLMGDQMRPRVVKRGVDDFATIVYGEREEVDHLVFVVPGIECLIDAKSKSVQDYADDFRSNAQTLLQSHFTEAFQTKAVNRVEFLPILWKKTLQEDMPEIQRKFNNITLPSTGNLRHFVNNTMIDMLYYNSPVFCQKICETVGNEMNRMFHIFLEKNQSFTGDVSVAGHGLGSVILFDLLSHQRLPGEVLPPPVTLKSEPRESFDQASTASSESRLTPQREATESDGSDDHSDETTLESLLSSVGLSDSIDLFKQEQIDMESLIMCSEQDLKDIGLPMGPRKKLLGVLKDQQNKKDENLKKQIEKKVREELEKKQAATLPATIAQVQPNNMSDVAGETAVKFLTESSGIGQLKVNYCQLDFNPSALFTLGSPLAMYISMRGVQEFGEMYQLPTCQRLFNVFHPFDPLAYRIEPMIRPTMLTSKPVQVPHYKGRKRLHLEFKDAVTRYGTDIKQKFIDSLKSTWNSINEFARSHRSDAGMDKEVQSEMDKMMSHIAEQNADDDTVSVSSMAEEDIIIGQLNEGQRIDYVLQEGPLESFNDNLFALTSHSCYWESEDTALFILREIYSPLGIRPIMPGKDGGRMSREGSVPPPPPSSAMTPGSRQYQSPMPPQYPSGLTNMMNGPFAPPPFQQNAQTPPQGPPQPPQVFSPQSLVSAPPSSMRKSPYVAPEFNSLPPTSAQSPAQAGPPPMGPALVGGYRRPMPKQ